MSQPGGGGGADPALEARVEYLEDNEYKITYYAEINTSTGTITKPTGSTILLDQFFGGVDAYVSTIAGGQPTGDFPTTAGGVAVDVSSFDTMGNFTLIGTPSSYPVALIYILKIKAKDYSNLDITKILDLENINAVSSVGATSPITSSGGTTPTISTSMATNKLIGRSTAGNGVMEEITIGSGLTLTGAGTLNNTATPTPLGYYGAFSDVTDQFAAAINTGYPMLLGVTDLSNQVTIVSGSRVTIANTGIYNIQWSAQFTNPTATIHDVTIWLRKNGVDVAGSSGIVAVIAKHGSFDGHVLPSWNFLIDPIAGDYYEFVWSTTDTSVYISFEPAGSPPPSTASVVLTVTQQSGIMAGTGITAINTLTGSAQTLTIGTTGTDFAIVDSGVDHKFNLPTASASNRGALSSADWTTFNGKQNTLSLTTTGSGAATLISDVLNIPISSGGTSATSNLFAYYNFI